MLTPGATAPDFELPDRSGVVQTLESLSNGLPLVLVFYRISCPACQYLFPFLDRLAKSDTVRVVGVSQDDAAGTEEFYQELGISLPSVIEQRGWAVGAAYRIQNVPSLFVIEPQGRTITMAEAGFYKAALEAIGQRAGVEPFASHELVPAFRPG
jgi:peroxiredoxin